MNKCNWVTGISLVPSTLPKTRVLFKENRSLNDSQIPDQRMQGVDPQFSPLLCLTDDALACIALLLDIQDVCVLLSVCKRLYHLSIHEETRLWMPMCQMRWGNKTSLHAWMEHLQDLPVMTSDLHAASHQTERPCTFRYSSYFSFLDICPWPMTDMFQATIPGALFYGRSDRLLEGSWFWTIGVLISHRVAGWSCGRSPTRLQHSPPASPKVRMPRSCQKQR